MAKTGIKYPIVAKGAYSETPAQMPTYSEGRVLGKAIQVDLDIKFSSNPLYADNGQAENEFTFEGGSVKMGIDDISLEDQGFIFGHTPGNTGEGEENNMLTMASGDTAPYVGLGYYKTGIKANVPYFEAVWIFKVKFKPPKESVKTSEGKVTWQTDETEGEMSSLTNVEKGPFRLVARFKTESAAVAWLNKQANIPEAATVSETKGK